MDKVDWVKESNSDSFVCRVLIGAFALVEDEELSRQMTATHQDRLMKDLPMEVELKVNGEVVPFMQFMRGLERRLEFNIEERAQEIVAKEVNNIFDDIHSAAESLKTVLQNRVREASNGK